MNLPKLLSIDEVAEYLDVTPATLEKWRTAGKGPNFIKAGAGIRYPENALAEYVQAQLQLPPIDGSKAATPAAIAAAMSEGRKGVREANAQRIKDMQQIDRDDYIPDADKVADPYAVTMGVVGAAGNFQRHSTVPGMQTFSDRPADVAVSNVQHGAVPVPWKKA